MKGGACEPPASKGGKAGGGGGRGDHGAGILRAVPKAASNRAHINLQAEVKMCHILVCGFEECASHSESAYELCYHCTALEA